MRCPGPEPISSLLAWVLVNGIRLALLYLMSVTEPKTSNDAVLATLLHELEGACVAGADSSGLFGRSLKELTRLEALVARQGRALEGVQRQLAKFLRTRQAEDIDVDQLLLGFPELLAPAPKAVPPVEEPERDDGTSSEGETRKPRRRRPASEDWSRHPRERREHLPPPEERLCCGREMERVGEEVRETRERIPATCKVTEDVTPKFRCACCGREAQAGMPPQALDGCCYGPMLVGTVVTNKFADHIPLNRQAKIFAREGQPIAKSMLYDLTMRAALDLEPIVTEMRLFVLVQVVIQCDETGIVVLDRDAPGGSRKGYIRVYRAPLGAAVFEFSLTKEGKWAKEFLVSYRGYLQADAASTFDALYLSGRIIEVGCNAHAMRKFRDLDGDGIPEVKEALLFYKRIYRIEREATERGLSPEDRLALRQERTRPLVDEFYPWLEEIAPSFLPSNPVRKAINYATNHRVALTRFLENGNLQPDNNRAELALRQIAVGRKNWEFAASEEGARHAATLYSIVVSCMELGVDPAEYVSDVLPRLGTTPAARIRELTPIGWKAARDGARASPCAAARPPNEPT
ncbi:MAG: IS66 family transposase [Candidatus Bipolaricaulota bacterium]